MRGEDAMRALVRRLEYLREIGICEIPVPGSRDGKRLREVAERVRSCTRCPLCSSRKRAVAGAGAPGARVFLVEGAPGADEDFTGRPPVGEEGALAGRILANVMGMEREEAYIANTVRCRPPDDRAPAPEEVEACRAYLDEELDIIAPDVIIALGKTAASALSEGEESGGRGEFRSYRGFGVMPTHHPSELLESDELKRETWEDIKKVVAALGEEEG